MKWSCRSPKSWWLLSLEWLFDYQHGPISFKCVYECVCFLSLLYLLGATSSKGNAIVWAVDGNTWVVMVFILVVLHTRITYNHCSFSTLGLVSTRFMAKLRVHTFTVQLHFRSRLYSHNSYIISTTFNITIAFTIMYGLGVTCMVSGWLNWKFSYIEQMKQCKIVKKNKLHWRWFIQSRL